jgi:hypothetical protein
MSFSDIKIEDYTDYCIVVQGDTRKYKEDLKKLGGKYNGRLKNGPGWIFSKKNRYDIESFIKNGKRLVTPEEINDGEERTRQYIKDFDKDRSENGPSGKTSRSYTRVDRSEPSHTSINSTPPTLTEYGSLITLIKNMSSKIDVIEKALSLMLDKDQQKELIELMKPKDDDKQKKRKIIVKRVKPVKSVQKEKYDSDSDESNDSEKSSESDEDIIQLRRLMR